MPATGFLSLQSILLAAGPLGATLHVPADYPTIQACINAAVSGVDECIVAPGTYNETINFLGKAILLSSSDGADVTTIDATGLNNHVVTCASGEGPDTVLRGFTLTGGRAYEGGGMYNVNSNPTVIDCIFFANVASAPNAFGDGSGGGMYNLNSSPGVTNCVFRHNKSIGWGGGGGMANYYSSPTVTYCTFSGNDAGEDGGGMYNLQGSPKITRCTFSGNTANVDSGFGGGMYNGESNPTVTNCTFSGNRATWSGGGMYNHGGSPTVTNCMFSGNVADDGGGMYNSGYNSAPTVTNCTFSGNTAGSGGGMYNLYNSTPTVTNCILWGDSPDEIVNVEISAPSILSSDVQGGLPVGAIDGGGNLYLDPMFVRPPDPGPDGMWDGVDDDYGDLRLQAGSPCINAGDPGFVAQSGETDLEGHARVLCGRVDMGAYEFGIGDYDCDQTVDLTDFAQWPACATGPQNGPYDAGCQAFDFDGDGDVDLFDFTLFQITFDSTDLNHAVFDDPQSNFLTRDVRDVDNEIVRFDTSTNSIIWAATGAAFHPGYWTVNGVFLAGGAFQVRFGTQGGQRRAYFTETGPATICQIQVIGSNLYISPTNVLVPQE